MKTVSIIGGTGYVGTYLSAILVKAGFFVKIFSRGQRVENSVYCLPNVKLIKGIAYDDEEVLKKHLAGTDIVINLVGSWASNAKYMKRTQIDLPLMLYKVASSLGIERMLHISTLGASSKGQSIYHKSKYLAEQGLLNAAEKSNTALNILRPSLIIGHDDVFTGQMSAYIHWLPILPLPMPNAMIQPISIEDFTLAIYRVLTGNVKQQIIELAGPKSYTLYEYVSLMAIYIKGNNKGIVKVPDFLVSFYTKFFGWIPGSPITRNQFLTAKVPNTTTENALKKLNIDPMPMESLLPFELRHNILDKYYNDRLEARR